MDTAMTHKEKEGVRTSARRQSAKRPTLKDVAREAGVGTTTVSRIINGGRYVEAGTLARVQAVMKNLGYQPNHAARALKGERTRTLGLIVPTLEDIFFANLAGTAQAMVRQHDYVLIVLASEDDAKQETSDIDVFQSYRVDGLIVVPPRIQTPAFLAAVKGLRVPVVAIDRPLLSRNSSVTCDNYEASFAATKHLIDHGRKRILSFGGDPELWTIQERQRGYRDALTQAGLASELMFDADTNALIGRIHEAMARPKSKRPDAILGLLNLASILAFEQLMALGVSIPQSVALLSFDDFALSSTLRPAISVIRQPVAEMSKAATRLIFEQIQSGVTTPHHITLSTEFIPRSSCGCE
jgi:LacI family transcriptional regulator